MSFNSTNHDGDEPLAAERLVRLENALSGLARQRVPRALKPLVIAHLSADERELANRAEASFACLKPLTAPAELRDRVVVELAAFTPVAALLRDFERQQAPHVLRRLVEEEVADAKAPIVRFMRSLPRQSGPAEVRSGLTLERDGSRSERPLLALGSRRLVAAAALVITVGVASFSLMDDAALEPNEGRAFRFQRTYVEDTASLHPMSRGLLMGMAPDALAASALDARESGANRTTTDGGGR